MTGFGVGEATAGRGRIRVEVKSFNHRFLEIRIRLPKVYQGFEPRLYPWVRDRVERGRVELLVQLLEHDKQGSSCPIVLNRETVEAYINLARQVKEHYGVSGTLNVNTLLTLHEVFQPHEDIVVDDEEWNPLVQATERALKEMAAMQSREGEMISKDLDARVGMIEVRLAEIGEIAKDLPGQFRERLERRISQILPFEGTDPQRIAEEVVLYADKTDITEEIVRIQSHVGQLRLALSTGLRPGKKLEFLVQEIHREVNTMGAKSQDYRISHLAVDIKTELEKIREQTQNLQ